MYNKIPITLKSPWLLKVDIGVMPGHAASFDLEELVFHVSADLLTAFTLLRWLHTYDPHKTVPVLYESEKKTLACLPADSFESVGFQDNESLLPRSPYGSLAQDCFWDFFHFPHKFLFFRVKNLDIVQDDQGSSSFSLLFPLGSDATPDQWPLKSTTLSLGCVPAVNLFPKTSEPIQHNYQKARYKLVPDYRNEACYEVFSIRKVSSVFNFEDPGKEFYPYFSYTYAQEKRGESLFWYVDRQQTALKGVSGTDTWLSFVDYDGKLSQLSDEAIYAHTLCTNREIARSISVSTSSD